MIPLLIPLLTAVLPAILPGILNRAVNRVVLNAETIPGDPTGPEKKDWVMNFFYDLEKLLKSRGLLNEKVEKIFNAFLPELSERIETAIDKFEAKGKM